MISQPKSTRLGALFDRGMDRMNTFCLKCWFSMRPFVYINYHSVLVEIVNVRVSLTMLVSYTAQSMKVACNQIPIAEFSIEYVCVCRMCYHSPAVVLLSVKTWRILQQCLSNEGKMSKQDISRQYCSFTMFLHIISVFWLIRQPKNMLF